VAWRTVHRRSCGKPLPVILLDSGMPGSSKGTTGLTTPETNLKGGGQECPLHTAANYPFTLTRENDNIARPVVGLPMESAGRKVVKVVKISMFFFNWGSNGSSSLESDRMR
jgi:hypothetical protein